MTSVVSSKAPRAGRESSSRPVPVEAVAEAPAHRLSETASERDREGGPAVQGATCCLNPKPDSLLALDRLWRNARVHAPHDPVYCTLHDLGRHALTGFHPEPTAYS